MKILSLTFILIFISVLAQAQTKAVTDTGEEVLLFDDGTWKYANKDSTSTQKTIPLNPQKFVKKVSSSFLLKSKKMKIGVWINPKKWRFESTTVNSDAEYEMQFRKGDFFCLMITEKISIPMETLKRVAILNAKRAASNFKLIHEEYRIVNGNKVLCLKLAGTLQGIDFVYLGYYYSNETGSIQLMTYTSKNLAKQYEQEANELLNGLVEIK